MSKVNTNILWRSWHFLVKLWEATGRDYGNFPFFKKQMKDKNRRNKIPLRVRKKFTIQPARMSMPSFFPSGSDTGVTSALGHY